MLRETSFRYIPAALPGEEGYYTGLYSDHSAEDPALQMTARFASDRDCDARALRFEIHSTRVRLYRALTLLAPFVSVALRRSFTSETLDRGGGAQIYPYSFLRTRMDQSTFVSIYVCLAHM